MESIFNWAPIEDQWWVTGFNPDFTKPDPYDLTKNTKGSSKSG